ncbi:hypothetical protein HHK36_022296 [Tetracentron sinense]|uniref:Uncharacterized protein n=1 Tax=Tetracentron sinense TaxID=13715 RepID=A0A834YUN0_TETSI|nr:hypothetical protein HHK36_022296 [Tetracentron sinense]
MDRAKETIKEAMGGQRYERRYKPIWNIIDKRWNVQRHQPLHAAGYILNPEFYYNNQDIEPCEEIMKGLYEVIARDSLDPITLRDIDECNEWLIGSIQELVHEDDDLTWDQVAEAFGANEQCTRHTRSNSHLQRGGLSGSSRRMVEEEPLLVLDETDDEELYIDADNDDSDGVHICFLDISVKTCPSYLNKMIPGMESFAESAHSIRGLPQMVIESINKCDVDIRRELFSSILLAGGTASMQQLKERLEKDLLEESPQAARVKVLASGNAMERRFRIAQEHSNNLEKSGQQLEIVKKLESFLD